MYCQWSVVQLGSSCGPGAGLMGSHYDLLLIMGCTLRAPPSRRDTLFLTLGPPGCWLNFYRLLSYLQLTIFFLLRGPPSLPTTAMGRLSQNLLHPFLLQECWLPAGCPTGPPQGCSGEKGEAGCCLFVHLSPISWALLWAECWAECQAGCDGEELTVCQGSSVCEQMIQYRRWVLGNRHTDEGMSDSTERQSSHKRGNLEDWEGNSLAASWSKYWLGPYFVAGTRGCNDKQNQKRFCPCGV